MRNWREVVERKVERKNKREWRERETGVRKYSKDVH